MLYSYYEACADTTVPFRIAARAALKLRTLPSWFGGEGAAQRRMFSILDLLSWVRITHKRPAFRIGPVLVGNREYAVREEVVDSLPFCNLIHFAKPDLQAHQPKMLVVAPLSGHFATLLRSTVQTLLRDHDVYVTDWANARDVPTEHGAFGFDDYIDYVIRFLELTGPRANVLAVCQPCVHTLAAVALMAEDNNPSQPATMTLMGGPIDTRISPTKVNVLATDKPLTWFRKNLISSVPVRHEGRGRAVYPGFLQLSAFMSMNMERHVSQHKKMYELMADGREEEAAAIRTFYDEYCAVLDLTAEFYLETVDRVFQQALLPQGKLEYRGRPVRTSAIKRTALLTVEGERDDICAVGQTASAHDLCSSLRPHLKRHHLQPGVGHYGLFSGTKWDRQIYPQVKNLVLAMS